MTSVASTGSSLGSAPRVLRAWRSACLALAAAGSIGLLASGSCQASYCSEDCDPCLRQCRCKSSICYTSSAAFAATHTLIDYSLHEVELSGGAVRRTFRDVMGMSVQRAGGPTVPDEVDCVRFAQGVLAVQPQTFEPLTADGGRWAIEAVIPYDSAWVVQFRREVPAARSDDGASSTSVASDGARRAPTSLARSRAGVGRPDEPADTIEFLFDARGNLLEIDQVAAR